MRRILCGSMIWNRTAYLGIVATSVVGAFLLRFDFSIPPAAVPLLRAGIVLAVLIKLPVFHLMGLHRQVRRFAGAREMWQILLSNVGASGMFAIAMAASSGGAFPRSVYGIDFLLTLSLCAAAGFSVRLLREAMAHEATNRCKRILVHGLGDSAASLLWQTQSNPALGYEVVALLDEDLSKRGAVVQGVPVLGTSREAGAIVDRSRKTNAVIDEIVLMQDPANERIHRDVLANCRAAGVPCKILPRLTEMLDGQPLKSRLRNVSLTDLLGREPVHLDKDRIHSSLTGRCVLVTGAAGSIGSEICRQVLQYVPARLVLFDQAETELFYLEHSLASDRSGARVTPVLGDIRNPAAISGALQRYRIDTVFHAAAYKHVPMMERQVIEAIHNNICGAWNLVNAARVHGVSSLVQISTDKAVNPVSVMGATKRVCELIASSVPANGRVMKSVSVRFGNVLGSNGSVVPLFERQIAAGGPVKVTHPDMRRYFMTIPEAVMLVLQASTMGAGSEVFVLDMGEPVRILDLAENLIWMAGLIPYRDIEIQFTGARPGERLYEELGFADEKMLPTFHDKIRIYQDRVCSWSLIEEWMAETQRLITARDEAAAYRHLTRLVPEYRKGPEFEPVNGRQPPEQRFTPAAAGQV